MHSRVSPYEAYFHLHLWRSFIDLLCYQQTSWPIHLCEKAATLLALRALRQHCMMQPMQRIDSIKLVQQVHHSCKDVCTFPCSFHGLIRYSQHHCALPAHTTQLWEV